jgi:hypothetical protein
MRDNKKNQPIKNKAPIFLNFNQPITCCYRQDIHDNTQGHIYQIRFEKK